MTMQKSCSCSLFLVVLLDQEDVFRFSSLFKQRERPDSMRLFCS